jgi:hypothetical protein
MNTKKEIERYLQTAPKPTAPDGLLERLRENATSTDTDKRDSLIRRWFAPTGQSMSPWRVAVAAAIAVVLMLPLSYGAIKIAKVYIHTFVEESRWTDDDGTVHMTVTETVLSSHLPDPEKARKALEEFGNLYRQGKAVEIKPGVWAVTLSDGEEFAYSGRHPELVGLPDAEKKDLLRKQSGQTQE